MWIGTSTFNFSHLHKLIFHLLAIRKLYLKKYKCCVVHIFTANTQQYLSLPKLLKGSVCKWLSNLAVSLTVAAPGGARGENAPLKFCLPPTSVKSRQNRPTFCEIMKKWSFSWTKWSKPMTFWGSYPPEVVKTMDSLRVLPPWQMSSIHVYGMYTECNTWWAIHL